MNWGWSVYFVNKWSRVLFLNTLRMLSAFYSKKKKKMILKHTLHVRFFIKELKLTSKKNIHGNMA